jgi:hypothetical protein
VHVIDGRVHHITPASARGIRVVYHRRMFVVGLVGWFLVGMGLAAGLWWWGRRRGRGLGPLLATLGLAVYLLGTYAVIRWHLDAVERELRRDPEKLRALREEAREAREAREEARERAQAMERERVRAEERAREEALRARELELDGEGPSPPGDYSSSPPWRPEDLLPVPIEEFDVSRDTGRTKRP